jgi:SAM-dependent methyltransferase
VAVDVIPEVFTLFKDDRYAWANGHVYQSPLVETVAADGRNYLEHSGRQFDLIVLPNTESFAAVVRALFEPGQRIHTVEAFEIMRRHLKPNGILAIVKTMDSNERLFNGYAAGLLEVGLNTVGWIHPTKGFPGQPLVLLASPTRAALDVGATAREWFDRGGFTFVDFQETPVRGEPIYDDSPWILGVMGSFIPADKLRVMFLGIGAVACVGVALLIGISGFRQGRKQSFGRHVAFILAGVGVGVHAVYLQNGVIFWFLYHLFNPLAAFFLGTSLFLLMWGLSSALIRHWAVPVVISVLGIAGLLMSGGWESNLSLASMACLALGSGFCFPLLGLRFPTRLLDLFLADAIGGFSGGILGVWLPLSFGLGEFFQILPWVSGVTLTVVVISLLVSKIETSPVDAQRELVTEA